jgi:single-stranded-DNA-specific exonuclease
MRNWLEPQAINVPQDLQAAVGGHPLVAQVLARRGILTPPGAAAFLDPARYTPCLPTALPGLSAAADRLEAAIRSQEPICVWGDFDVDGQTSTTVLVSTLRDLGAAVTFHIPVRERESHGINLPVLTDLLDQGTRLVLTCDTGITAHAAVDFARARSVDFIITDHHELPPTLPQAVAVVNSRLLPAGHPLGTLPGVGVAYKLAEELYRRFGREGEALKLVDLAALGIVADLAIQTGDARYLVQQGLAALRQAGRLGIKAMLEVAELNATWLTEAHIGFELGPRLNALGRLSDANVSVELLTTHDQGRARVIAATLEGLNTRRQLLTNQVFQAAQAQLENDPALLEEPALVLAHPAWPAGVIGIVASHLVERYNRPVVLIADPPGELARGSARSIPSCDITAAIASQEHLLSSFGGHPMAAGLSIDPQRIPEFRRGLSRAVQQMVGIRPAEADLPVDGYLSLSDLSLELVEDFQRLAPFGPGNPALVLVARNLSMKSHAAIGRNGEHLQLTVEDDQGCTRKVLWWGGAGGELPQGQFDLAFTVQASDFRGVREVQVEWIDARLLQTPAPLPVPAREIEVIDYRRQPYPMAALKQLVAGKEVQVWGEADAVARLLELGIPGCGREALAPGRELVIWTTPPGRKELQAAIERVSPEVVYLFGMDPDAVELDLFLKRLAGLVKYLLSAGRNEADLPALASATGQREAAVRKGLEWLAGRGYISLLKDENGRLNLAPGQIASAPDPAVTAQLKTLLAETAAYREYFHTTDKISLISVDS